MTTLSDALGREIIVLSAPAVFRRERGPELAAERAVLLLHYDLDGVYLRDTTTGQLSDAFTRWMQQMSMNPVDDLHAELPDTDWTLRQCGIEYVVERHAGDDHAVNLATGVGDFPARWWYLAQLQGGRVQLLATNMPCGPVLRSWHDGEEIHDWIDGAVKARRVWGGTITVEMGPSAPPPRRDGMPDYTRPV